MKPLILTSLLSLPIPALADDPQIIDAKAALTSSGWKVSVTLTHPDTGWDHFADGWRVLDTSGNELGLRVLAHPHVTEQPFTRSLLLKDVPKNLQTLQIQARCLVDGWGSELYSVELK